jgi:hypothetical protein
VNDLPLVSPPVDRRSFLERAGGGFGMVALASLLAETDAAPPAADPLAPRPPHFPAKAKSVIWLFMNGGQSHVDTWDYKPELEKSDGKKLERFDSQTGFFPDAVGPLMKSPFKFARHGKSGAWASEILPHLARHVDDLAFIHSCHTETNNHSPALFQINTGFSRMGFPCVGSWVNYGLGSPSRDLPAFCVMIDTLGRGVPKGHAQNWSAGFLPGVFQGTQLAVQGPPIDRLDRPKDVDAAGQRRQLDFLGELNRGHQRRTPVASAASAELAARIESFELACRMQTAAPEALDLGREPAHIRKLYGLDDSRCSHFARQCLMARRLVERGVRFVQIYSGGMENQLSWDGHVDLAGNHRQFAGETDQPIAGLLADLKQRGLWDSTLVICCGEFGRLPVAQKNAKPGRDHNPHAFTAWLAGGGTRGGVHYGETDEVGLKAARDRVSVNDLHATILHLVGLNHERLTYRFNGRDFRLTDVAGRVVREILA